MKTFLSEKDDEQIIRIAMATIGLDVQSWSVDHVTARPGGERAAQISVSTHTGVTRLVATNAELAEHSAARIGAVRLDRQHSTVYVWAFPRDPKLPGLERVGTLESAIQFGSMCAPPLAVEEIEVMAYRPMRRAVVKISGTRQGKAGTWFVKAVRPERAHGVAARFNEIEIAPRAETLKEGLVLLEQAAGVDVATSHSRGIRINAQLLSCTLDALPGSLCSFPQRKGWAAHFDKYVPLVRTREVDSHILDSVVPRTRALMEAHPPGPLVPTHGDLTAANVRLNAQGEVVSLIDVDTAGPGHRVDDYACLIAHVAALGSLAPHTHGDTLPEARRLASLWGQEDWCGSVRGRAAAVLVSLAAGAPTALIARAWVGDAHALLESQV